MHRISMRRCEDFYYVPNFDIGVANIKCVDFKKIAPNAQEIDLSGSVFAGVAGFDFGPNVKKINLQDAVFTDMNFARTAPNAKEIDLRYIVLRNAVAGITANVCTKLLLDNQGSAGLSLTTENGIIKMYTQRERW